jgi:small conductance mechanosensitive channel
MSFQTVVQAISAWLSTNGLRIILVFVAAWLLNRVAGLFIDRLIRKIVKPDFHASAEAEKKREDTLISVFGGAFSVVLYLAVGMMVLSEFGVNIGPLIAGAGVAGVAVGFGAQYLVRDIITGLFIIMENQYRVGDVICLDGTCGQVETINLRMTVLRDADGTVHCIPNGEIKKTSNLSKDFSRVNLDVGVGYDADIEKVIETVNRTGAELAADPAFKEMIRKPPTFLRVNNFLDSAVEIRISAEVMPLKQWDVAGELRKRIKLAFDEAGIEIPFPQRVVHTRGES